MSSGIEYASTALIEVVNSAKDPIKFKEVSSIGLRYFKSVKTPQGLTVASVHVPSGRLMGKLHTVGVGVVNDQSQLWIDTKLAESDEPEFPPAAEVMASDIPSGWSLYHTYAHDPALKGTRNEIDSDSLEIAENYLKILGKLAVNADEKLAIIPAEAMLPKFESVTNS